MKKINNGRDKRDPKFPSNMIIWDIVSSIFLGRILASKIKFHILRDPIQFRKSGIHIWDKALNGKR